jgi:Kef-type K+ transport system membrane component KefB
VAQLTNVWFIAAAWMLLAFIASVLSIRTGVSVALLEIAMGVIAGNVLGIHTTDWINFLATFGAGLLTFLAGAEIDPQSLRLHLKAAVVIGIVSFLVPFLAAWGFAYWLVGWTYHGSLICGIALSTTSVAVVYAVMVETGLSSTSIGKLILAGCFVTDFGTVLALGVFFADFNRWLILFVAVLAVVLRFLPQLVRSVITTFGASRVSEPR